MQNCTREMQKISLDHISAWLAFTFSYISPSPHSDQIRAEKSEHLRSSGWFAGRDQWRSFRRRWGRLGQRTQCWAPGTASPRPASPTAPTAARENQINTVNAMLASIQPGNEQTSHLKCLKGASPLEATRRTTKQHLRPCGAIWILFRDSEVWRLVRATYSAKRLSSFFVTWDCCEHRQTNTQSTPTWLGTSLPVWLSGYLQVHHWAWCRYPLEFYTFWFNFCWRPRAVLVVGRIWSNPEWHTCFYLWNLTQIWEFSFTRPSKDIAGPEGDFAGGAQFFVPAAKAESTFKRKTDSNHTHFCWIPSTEQRLRGAVNVHKHLNLFWVSRGIQVTKQQKRHPLWPHVHTCAQFVRRLCILSVSFFLKWKVEKSREQMNKSGAGAHPPCPEMVRWSAEMDSTSPKPRDRVGGLPMKISGNGSTKRGDFSESAHKVPTIFIFTDFNSPKILPEGGKSISNLGIWMRSGR